EQGLAVAARLGANSEECDSLTALGLTWKARVALGGERLDEARRFIDRALNVPCKPVVKYRVNFIAGDIALKQRDAQKALDYYHSAVQCAEQYDGEGRGYQTLPRIALALIALRRADDAERAFDELSKCKATTGILYAQY